MNRFEETLGNVCKCMYVGKGRAPICLHRVIKILLLFSENNFLSFFLDKFFPRKTNNSFNFYPY